MVTLIAKQAVDSNQLPGVSMLFKPHTAYFYSRNNDDFKVAPDARLEGTLLEVRGDDFRYLFSRPTGAGTVTQLIIHSDNDPYYKISGLDLELRDIFKADLETAAPMFFKGKDKFRGSPENDIFDGHKGKDKLLGKDGVDSLYGKADADVLDGGGGSDTLNGGGGIDTYVFRSAPDPSVTDAIVNFRPNETIELGRKKAFQVLSKGPLPEDQFFVTGDGVQDENDYIVFNPSISALYYDSDGNGPTPAIKFTTLQAGFDNIGSDNFVII